MNDALALVFDVGTQSVRAMLFDAAGHIVRSAQDIYEQPIIPAIRTGRSSGPISILSIYASSPSG